MSDQPITPMVERLSARPADISEDDWAGIVKGSAFARAVGIVQGDSEGKDADGWLDVAGEYEEALKAEGYVVVQAGRLEAAEAVCLMVGWSAADNSERGKARHELWRDWLRLYEVGGGSHEVRAHPELSDARIKELAAQRDEQVATTLAAMKRAKP